jgi:hypothetical protein
MGALKLAFATDVVDPCDRFDLWHEVACKAYAEHECTTQSPGSFEGVIRSAQLDKATLSIYENTPMHLWRTQRQVERAPSDRVFICLQIDSTCRISQLGRETTIGPGEFCIVETKNPTSSRMSKDPASSCSISKGRSCNSGSAPSVRSRH